MGTHIGTLRAGLVLLALLPVGAASSAQAQVAPGDECAASPTPAEEIACLRRALKAKNDALAARAPKAPERKADRPIAAAVPVAPTAPAAAPAMARASEDIGREQMPNSHRVEEVKANKEAGLQALVVAAREDREGLFRISLGNGQVWKQVERPSVQIIVQDGRQYPVEITKSGFGGYRMFFADLRRTIVVKRLQ